MASTHPAAVLFDMDGTLVDSEKLWDIGLHELARRYGGTLSDAARLAMVGTDMPRTMELLHRGPRPARPATPTRRRPG